MFLLAIDPHIKKSNLAIFYYDRLRKIMTVDTKKFIKNPSSESGARIINRVSEKRLLIIERPWVGKNPKGSISLAIIVGQIMGSLIRSGFESHEAPAWGNDGSWISDMLSLGRRMPTSAQVAKLSIQIAKNQYPEFSIDKHSAAAICMGLWFLKKRKMKIA
jgi:hypothetical protein